MPKNWALGVALATSCKLPGSGHRIGQLRRLASRTVVKPSFSAAVLLGILLAGKSSPALAIRAVYDCEPVVANCTIDGCEVKGSQCTLIGWEYENSDFALLNDRSRPTAEDDRDETGPVGGPGRVVDKKIGEKKEAEQKPCDEPTTGQPVVIATGNKIKPEIDFVLPPDQNPLALVRFYDKSLDRIGIFGKRWASSIEYSLSFEYGTTFCAGRLDAAVACSPTAPLSKIYAVRTSGFALIFQNQNGVWTDGKNTISSVGGQWVLTLQDGGIETYDGYGRPLSILDARGIGLSYAYSGGKLSTVTHTSGRSIQIAWSGTKVGTVTAPNSKIYAYTYSGNNLVGVAYPDNLGTRTYHYEDGAQPSGLTGISINGVRYSRYAYQADGRVAWSGLEGGTERSTFTYGSDYTDVTNATGQTTRYLVADFNGSKRTIGVERPASSTCAAGARYTAYGIDGNIDYELDAFGVKKDYTYDADGHPTQLVAGLGPYGETDQQQITQYIWDAAHKGRLNQVKVFGSDTSNPRNTTTYTYYPDGDARARLLQAVAVTNQAGGTVGTLTTTYDYTLHSNGLIATMTVDGPLSGAGDSVVSTFDAAGNLLTVRNSLNHTTTYANYNALGQPGQITSPNGAVTAYTYNARGQMLTEKRTVNGVVQTTTTSYDTRGRPITVVAPDGSRLDTSYDNFDRVTSVYRFNELPDVGDRDEPGDAYDQTETRKRVITYNLLSQPLTVTTSYVYFGREWDETRGKPIPLGYTELQHKVTYEYDAGGFLSKQKGEHGQSTTYHYNANGDVDWVQDALGNRTSYAYDRHRRVSAITDANNGVTTIGYNATGQVKLVRDPRNNPTTYSYDGFGNMLSQASPDTGVTTFSYNTLGQRIQMQRADLSTTDYTYDTLGRLKTIASGGQTRTLTYDACTGGKGLLCTAAKTGGTATTTSFTYTPWGQVASRQDVLGGTTDTTAYSYDGMLRLAGISYPSGISVGYGYGENGLGVINATVNGTNSLVAGFSDYRFLGPPRSVSYGNSLWGRINYDTDGRITGISTRYSTPVQSLTYGFDTADRITAITDGVDAGLTQNFGYDALSRISSAAVPGGNAMTAGYDPAGNRITRSDSVPASSTTYTYASTSNRLQQTVQGALTRTFSTNANGDIDAFTGPDGVANTLAYDPFGRLASHVRSGVATTYTVNALDQRIAKSNAGTSSRYIYGQGNQLLAEYTNGQWTSYVWSGNAPVAMVRNNQIYYLHTDHLGRPQLATDASRTVVWKASTYAFNRGTALDSIGGLNLGFPGQYLDAESGLWHNGYRDYDGTLGRFLQSDPIGLEGGINTYAYVGGNPVNLTDRMGLACDQRGCWNTSTELAYANAGNYGVYYQAACSGGDSYACVARIVATGQGNSVSSMVGANFTNGNLRNSLKRGGSDCPEADMENVRKDLMIARVNQLSGATPSNPMRVSAQSISDFHNAVFSSYGATDGWGPFPVFGGDIPVIGNMGGWEWCSSPACQP